MSTLWFDVMSRYCEDPDWSNLPGTDRSGLELLSSDDELLDDDPDFYEYWRTEPQYRPEIDDLDRVKSLSRKSSKNFSWLKPPENWISSGG